MENEKALLEKIQDDVKSIIADASKENAKRADVDKALDAINERIKNLSDESKKELNDRVEKQAKEIDDLNSALKAQGLEIAKFSEKSGKEVAMDLREAIKQALLSKKDLMLTEKNDDNGERLSLKDYFEKNGNKQSPVFHLKAAVDMLGTNIFGNQVGLLRLTELDPNRVGTPLTIYPHAINAFSSKNISRPSMSLMVVHTYWDGTGTKPEGTTSGQSNFSFKTVEFKTFNIATFFGLSDETLDDMDETLDEISVTAPSKILDKIDSKVFADAGDNSTDIRGLFVNGETCTDFVASTYATTVLGANMVDLIAKMKLAISKNKYKANRVCLNPSDVDNIQCLKDQLDNSITDRRLVFNMNGELVKIAGLEIVQSEFITENTCLVCDSAQVWFGIRKGLTMEIGLNGTDFVEGQKTVRFGTRLALGVKDKAALQYSVNMATDLTTITKTGA